MPGPPRHPSPRPPVDRRAQAGCTVRRPSAVLAVPTGGLHDLVVPHGLLRALRGRGEGVTATLVRAVEVLAGLPGVVGLLVLPPGVDQVGVRALDGAEQLEPLEARGALHGPRPALEAVLEALPLVLRHGHDVDLHDAHERILPNLERGDTAGGRDWARDTAVAHRRPRLRPPPPPPPPPPRPPPGRLRG